MPTIKNITPHLWFDNQAVEAAEFYVSVFPDSSVLNVVTMDGTPSGSVDTVVFNLSGNRFMAISAGPLFKFNEAISFMVYCEDQAEIDYYWEKLGAGGDPNAQQCGWLKDKFGLSWQIVPTAMDEMMVNGNKEQLARVTKAFMQMKKFNLAELEAAYNGQ